MIHQHKWHVSGHSSKSYWIRCSCGENKEIPANSKQKKILKAEFKKMFDKKSAREMHGLSWQMDELVKKYPDNNWGLICAAERLAKKNPDRIFLCRVDDDYHSGSELLFIVNRTKDRYMGVSVWMLSQCAQNPPCPFFLYPSHIEGIIPVLTKLLKEAKTVSKRQNKIHTKESKLFKKALLEAR